MGNFKKNTFCCYIILTFSACSTTTKHSQYRDYIYNEQTSNMGGHGIILSRVYDNRIAAGADGLFNKFIKTVDKINSTISETVHGNHYMAAQIVLLGPGSNRYYLGDHYSPDFRDGIKSDLGASDRHYRKTRIGNKSDFKVYDRMAAYSVLSLPEGEYSVIASAYYNEEYTNVQEFMYSAKSIKKFYLAPGEIVYIGDIAALPAGYSVIDEFAQAREFVSYAYPKLSARLTFKPLR